MEKNNATLLQASELNKSLEEYKGILGTEIIDYLDSLIGLEISALNQGLVSENVIKKLNELKLYRQIVIYNIYNKALSVLKSYGNGFNLEECREGLSIFEIDRKDTRYDVFSYWPNENGVSNIVLKQTILDPVKRQEQIDGLYYELEELKKLNPKKLKGNMRFLSASREDKIKYISDLIKELESRSSLDGNIEYVVDAQEYFIRQMLDNQGLQVSQDFVERPAFSQSDIAMQSIPLNTYPNKVNRALTKKLVKTYPHTTISKYIKFY